MTEQDAVQRICPFMGMGDTRHHCVATRCMMWSGDAGDGDCALATSGPPGKPRNAVSLAAAPGRRLVSSRALC
jgi:hypothetical protein